MKIVVTGALGHIGSYLIRDFPQRVQGAEILMIDNLSTQRYASLFNLGHSANYRFVEGDILGMDLAPLLEGAAVIHLAGATDAAGSLKNRKAIEENLGLTKRVAEACIESGASMLFPSTTSVYGTQEDTVDEDCRPEDLKPQSPYAETKLREEELLQELGASRNLRYVICRLGTICGTSPGMRFHTAVNKFCWQAVMGQPVTVWRTAYEQKRPYLDLFDAARAIEFIVRKDLFDRRIYNVLSVNSTVREIVEIIRRFIPDLQVESTESKIMNQLSYEVSNQRFRNLDFEFKGSLEIGIRDTIELLKPSKPDESIT